jgi:hypothetical protein
MTNTMNCSLVSRISRSALGRGLGLLLVSTALLALTVVAQTGKPRSDNSSGPDKRQHVATIRTSDSSDGSRVSITADMSLNDYEAYRRGDRFYVKLPAIDVPRAQTLKGRGFEDVKVQRSADSTMLSFRLEPGASARVEQRANRLEVVFVSLGSSPLSARTNPTPSVTKPPAPARSPRSAESDSSRRPTTTKQANAKEANLSKSRSGDLSRINDNQKTRAGATSAAGKLGPKATVSPSAKDSARTSSAEKTRSSASASPSPSDVNRPSTGTASQSATTSSTPATNGSQASSQLNSSPATASPANQSTLRPPAPTGDAWAARMESLKERARYLMLLGRLNPIPLAIGLGILLLLIVLFIFQRHRSKATRRVRRRTGVAKTLTTVQAEAGGADTVTKSAETAASAKPEPVKSEISQAELVAAGAATGVAAATVLGSSRGPIADVEPESTGAPVTSTRPVTANGAQQARVAEEVRHVLAGEGYDQSVIGARDGATRKMVAAELLASLASRNPQRRDRAREVFIKHGYFDDATGDLRLAESPADRASAARRLSFVRDRDASPHLIAALEDPAPEVRRAAVEALVDAPDPVAIAPLNNLLKVETNRKVPQALIRHAIDACATCNIEQKAAVSPTGAGSSSVPSSEFHPPLAEQEREVIEI